MLANSNEKLGEDVYNFNLSRDTCKYKTPLCEKYCYARKGNFVLIENYLQRNYLESLEDDFVERICGQIMFKQIKWIRIHASGDFYNQSYVDKWIEIAQRSPKTKFLAYTRNWEADFSKRPANFVIYNSCDKATIRLNKGLNLLAYAEEININTPHMTKTNLNTYACNSKCHTCKACWSGRIHIVFPLRK
jgi:hypothetical protein